MTRRLVGIVVGLIVLIVLALFIASFFLGSILKKGVEKVGPTVTKVDVKLASASLAPFSGRGQLDGLLVGNPPGFKAPSALKIGAVAVQIVPKSVFADKVVVRSIRVEAPEITLEGGLNGNNLTKLLDNVRSSEGSTQPGTGPSKTSASRKLQVDDLLLTGGKLNLRVDVLGGQSATVALPDIHLTDLGQGSDGITPAELSEKLLRAIVDVATKAASTQLTSLGKNLGGAAQMISTGAVKQVEQATRGLGNLFKKKE